jgi:hypothetical protein
MTRTQAAMQAVEQIEKQESNVVPGPGIGHNNPPPDRQAQQVADAKRIYQDNLDLPTTRLAKMISDDQAEIQKLHTQIGLQEAVGQKAVQDEIRVYEVQRGMLETELADAVKRRDNLIETLNEEISGIRTRMASAETEHEVKKGQLIRHNQNQVEAMEEMITRLKRSLGVE